MPEGFPPQTYYYLRHTFLSDTPELRLPSFEWEQGHPDLTTSTFYLTTSTGHLALFANASATLGFSI